MMRIVLLRLPDLKVLVSGNSVIAYDARVASPSVMQSQFSRIDMPALGPDKLIVDGLYDQPFDIPNYRVTGYRTPEQMPLGYWRSVGNSYNGFLHDCFLDELAYAASKDPMQMRLELINHAPSRKVLEKVAEMSDWGGTLPEGHARGVGFNLSFGVPTAEVIEIKATDEGNKADECLCRS